MKTTFCIVVMLIGQTNSSEQETLSPEQIEFLKKADVRMQTKEWDGSFIKEKDFVVLDENLTTPFVVQVGDKAYIITKNHSYEKSLLKKVYNGQNYWMNKYEKMEFQRQRRANLGFGIVCTVGDFATSIFTIIIGFCLCTGALYFVVTDGGKLFGAISVRGGYCIITLILSALAFFLPATFLWVRFARVGILAIVAMGLLGIHWYFTRQQLTPIESANTA